MAGSILDAILAQAKATITRAYLAAGLIPALACALGWGLYEARSVATLKARIEPVLSMKTADLSATALTNLMLIAAAGLAFYAARGLVLRTLEAVPGHTLAPLRRYLLARQINIWWRRRRLNRRREQQRTVIVYLCDGKLDEPGPAGLLGATEDTTPALQRSKRARTRFGDARERLERGKSPLTQRSIDQILDGLEAFYSIPLDFRQGEKADWSVETAGKTAKDLLSRLDAETHRRYMEVFRELHEQPMDEQWLAPTRLGNRISALQDYTIKRYKIPTSTLFTRLWGTLGQAERLEISSAQLTLETLANMVSAFALLAGAVAGTSAYRTMTLWRQGTEVETDWWTLWFVLACVGFSYLSYRVAVFAFESVAENITRLVDLHRVRILTAFGFAPPETFGEEQNLFRQLNEFFAVGKDEEIRHRKLEARQKPQPARGPAA